MIVNAFIQGLDRLKFEGYIKCISAKDRDAVLELT